MCPLMNVDELKAVNGNKYTNSLIVKVAIQRLKKKRMAHHVGYDEVIDPFEMILECHEVLKEINEKMDNNNACKKDE